MLGKRNKTQDFVLERTALYQLSCIPALSFYLREKCFLLEQNVPLPSQRFHHVSSTAQALQWPFCVAVWSRGTYAAAHMHYILRKGGAWESGKGRERHQLEEVPQEASAVLEIRKQQPKA